MEEEWLIYKDNSDCFKENEAVIERPQPDPTEVLLNEQNRVLTRARWCGQGDRSLVLELSHSQRDRTGCGPRVFTDRWTMDWLQGKIHLIHFLLNTDHLHLIKVLLNPVRPPSQLRLPGPEPGQHLAQGLNLLPERRQPGGHRVPAPEVAGGPLQPRRPHVRAQAARHWHHQVPSQQQVGKMRLSFSFSFVISDRGRSRTA